MREQRGFAYHLSMVLACASFVCGVGVVGQAWAADGSNGKDIGSAAAGALVTACLAQHNNDSDYCAKMLGSSFGTSSSDCKTEADDMRKANEDFGDSCNQTDKRDCERQAQDCIRGYVLQAQDLQDRENSSGDDPRTSRRAAQKNPDAALLTKLGACPSLGAADVEDLKKDMDAKKQKLIDLQSDLSKAQTEASKLQGDIKSAQQEVQTKAADIKQHLQETIDKMTQDNQTKAQNAMIEYNKMADGINQLVDKENEIVDKASDNLREEENRCFTDAMKARDAYIQDRQQHLSRSDLNSGGQSNLFATIGSVQQKSSKIAQEYYQFCLTHPPHTTAVKSINDAKTQQLAAVAKQIQSAKRDQQMVLTIADGQDAQNNLSKEFNSLNSSAQNQLKQLAAQAQDKVNQLTPELNAEMGTGNGNACTVPDASTRYTDPGNVLCTNGFFKGGSAANKTSQAGAQGEINRLKLEVSDAQSEQDVAIALYNKAHTSSGGNTNDKGKSITSNFRKLMTDAQAVFGDADCKCVDGPPNGACSTAEQLLLDAGGDYADAVTSTTLCTTTKDSKIKAYCGDAATQPAAAAAAAEANPPPK